MSDEEKLRCLLADHMLCHTYEQTKRWYGQVQTFLKMGYTLDELVAVCPGRQEHECNVVPKSCLAETTP